MSSSSLKADPIVMPNLPSSIAQIGVMTKYELLNYFRSRRFFILLIIDLIISSIFTALVAYYGVSSFATAALGFYSSWWGNSITLVVILSGIFFAGAAITGEFQNRTSYLLVGNPSRPPCIY